MIDIGSMVLNSRLVLSLNHAQVAAAIWSSE
jgi:hypothetical protein